MRFTARQCVACGDVRGIPHCNARFRYRFRNSPDQSFSHVPQALSPSRLDYAEAGAAHRCSDCPISLQGLAGDGAEGASVPARDRCCSTHVHLLARIRPTENVTSLVNRMKGASSAIAGKTGISCGGLKLYWGKVTAFSQCALRPCRRFGNTFDRSPTSSRRGD